MLTCRVGVELFGGLDAKIARVIFEKIEALLEATRKLGFHASFEAWPYNRISRPLASCGIDTLRYAHHEQFGRTGGFCRKVWYLGQNGKTDRNYFKNLQCQKLTKNKLCDRTLMPN